MITLNNLFNKYNFPPIKFIYWDYSFNCPLNSLEITTVNNIEGVFPKNNFPNIFNNKAPSIEYQFYYPHIINIEINPILLESGLLNDDYEKEFAKKYYLKIIKKNQYNDDEINLLFKK